MSAIIGCYFPPDKAVTQRQTAARCQTPSLTSLRGVSAPEKTIKPSIVRADRMGGRARIH